MVNYKCPRCGYTIDIKTKYIKHLKRKYLCDSILSDSKLNDEYIKYDIKEKITKITQKPTKSKKNPQKTTKKSLKCKYCEKIFSRDDSLTRHYKTCKEKRKDDECRNDMLELIKKLNEQLEENKKELDKKNNQIDELIKKAGITNNIQNNIKILAYKNTDISHLTEKDYLKCLEHSNFCVPNLIETIHLNPKKPENHNVYISNIKNKYAMVYDGNKWNLNNQDETIEQLFDINHDILEQKLEEWIENGKDYPEIMKKFNRYLEKKENDNIINEIKNEIKLILFNNRKMIS